jgi:hypothetical protein
LQRAAIALAVNARLIAHNIRGLGQDDVTGEALHYAALAYAATVEANARVLRSASGAPSAPRFLDLQAASTAP